LWRVSITYTVNCCSLHNNVTYYFYKNGLMILKLDVVESSSNTLDNYVDDVEYDDDDEEEEDGDAEYFS